MEEPIQIAPWARPVRALPAPGAVALRRQLETARAALAEETRRRETAQASWIEEVRRHEATQAVLAEETRRRAATQAALGAEEARRQAVELAAAEVAGAARGVLRARRPPAVVSAPPTAPVAARLASVLEVVAAPSPLPAGPAERDELVRRFEQVRSRLLDEIVDRPPPRR